jgi:pimeloyl-ACP methyl ester carboxylesterase
MRVSEEQLAPVNGIEIAYQEIGPPDGEPMVMIMGLGTQMNGWDLGFCELLASEGFRVIRFDNRHVGHSTWVDAPPANPVAALLGLRKGLAYTLEDMATDAAGLIEHLGLESAHVVGASQGGMIAQVLACARPERVCSLGLLMTGAGKRIASLPRLRALGTLLARPPRGRDAFIDQVAKTFDVIGSPAYPTDHDRLRELIAETYDRGHNAAGAARQLHAVTAAPERTGRLRAVRVPAVVIHGTRDPLIRPVAGQQVAKAIPGARLELIEGMGHDLPRELWPRIAGLLVDNARRAPVGEANAAPA